jgi:hypothetical protein
LRRGLHSFAASRLDLSVADPFSFRNYGRKRWKEDYKQ